MRQAHHSWLPRQSLPGTDGAHRRTSGEGRTFHPQVQRQDLLYKLHAHAQHGLEHCRGEPIRRHLRLASIVENTDAHPVGAGSGRRSTAVHLDYQTQFASIGDLLPFGAANFRRRFRCGTAKTEIPRRDMASGTIAPIHVNFTEAVHG